MLKGLTALAAAAVLTAGCTASSVDSANGSGDAEGAGKDYGTLPFTDILSMDDGAVDVGGKEEITIGFSQTCFNHPWRTEMVESAKAEVARHDGVKLIVADGNCDVADQSNDVADLISSGADAIILSPVESAGLAPAADRVMAANIPLIVLDRDVPTEKTLFIGQSNEEMAYETAKQMIEDMDGQGRILEITGLSGSSPATDRSAGLRRALKEAPGIEILAVGDGEWVREPAVTLMDDWLTKYDDIDAIFSHAEESSWGAQQAIANAGRCDENILHYTHDGSAPAFEWVKDGSFQADGNYSPYIGDIGVRAALMALQGESIPGAESYVEPGQMLQLPSLPTVVPENAEEWIPKGWGGFEKPVNPCA
ncbi:substrate-binding domain-containing protein [Aeromicrobium sp.]|uniref:substrate-binding domain-containing protein n=1 Tax=Aeromicrobium sp. TaxID=1871063 RepID=UPI0019A1B832|nr:substrate-binding domain-containing protein [Aeromicrobium sp.]MBC7633607.1 substrate-binding domain-containing protein [Aeromicrobium sp.]